MTVMRFGKIKIIQNLSDIEQICSILIHFQKLTSQYNFHIKIIQNQFNIELIP